MGAEHRGDGRSPVVALPIENMARVVGAYVWVERRLFEILGGFVAAETVPAAVLFFDARAQHHAWHAGLLAEQLPLLPGIGHDTLTVAPNAGVASALDGLAGATGALGRLAGLARVVLPRLLQGYRAHLDRTAPVADAPLSRVLDLVVHDEAGDLREAEALLERLGAADPAGLAFATDGLRGLEEGLAGVGPGILAWPVGGPDRA